MFGNKEKTANVGGTTTYIGKEMKIEGKLRCSGPIRIDGEINGDIDCENEISIGPSALIVATIHAVRIIVNGRVEGNLFASDQLEVLPAGHILGNVSNPPGKLIIHEGAIIEGQCFTQDVPKKLDFDNSKNAQSSKGQKNVSTKEAKLIGNAANPLN